MAAWLLRLVALYAEELKCVCVLCVRVCVRQSLK